MPYLLKNTFHNSIADTVYKDIVTRSTNYYYVIGRAIPWESNDYPENPVDSIRYENLLRSDIITGKLIKPTDICYIVPRYDWEENTIYDCYDDEYNYCITGINLLSGGIGYDTIPYVHIGSTNALNWEPISDFRSTDSVGKLLRFDNRYYIIVTGGVTGTTPPVHIAGSVFNGSTELLYVKVDDGGGFGATAYAEIESGIVSKIVMKNKGDGYLTNPSVFIAGQTGSNAEAKSVLTVGAFNGARKIEDSRFYVMTDDYRVYKCLDNNNGSSSTIKPVSLSTSAVKYSDGYVWKFMYVVPPALVNKFLTNQYLPVTTSLRSQFFSSGEINTIRIDSRGNGYSPGTIINVFGDGYIEDNPRYITGAYVHTAGDGYVSPTLSVTPPFESVGWQESMYLEENQQVYYNFNVYEAITSGFTGYSPPTHLDTNGVINGTTTLRYIETFVDTPPIDVVEWKSSFYVQLGEKYNYEDNIYEVELPGYTGSIPPTHLYGSIRNGSTAENATFKFIGSTITGDLVVTDGLLTDVVLKGNIRDIVVNFGGSGYNSSPKVTISGGGGTGAYAVATVVGGGVQYITVVNPGYNYTSEPIIIIGTPWGSGNATFLGEQVFAPNGSLYTVVDIVSGITNPDEIYFGSTSPTHLSGNAINGDVVLEYAGQVASAEASLKYGSGYSFVPTASISENNTGRIVLNSVKSEAQLIAIVDDGQISGVQIQNPGVGYTIATLEVSGTGSGASLSADLSYGEIDTLQSNVELLTVDGEINNIAVVSGGYGYSTASVTIRGNGVGATAEAVILGGVITKFNIINPGSGYRWAEIIIDSPTGRGASGRAIIGPYGGHGKNALNELYAKTLMIYANLSSEKNQGFDVENDFRQVGIIRSPRSFSTKTLLSTNMVSACWVARGPSNEEYFKIDTTLADINGYRYRIVARSSGSLLLQSLDDVPLQNGSLLSVDVDGVPRNFITSLVIPPTIDKYSGDLIIIDNKSSFSPTTEQLISIRTAIKF